MGMLSYKQYKLLHENLDSVIGISKPTNLGLAEAPQLFGMMSKMAKRMPGDVPPGLKKGAKPPMDDAGGDMDDMGDEDMGDEENPDMGDDADLGDEDMGDDDADADAEGGDDDMGDDEEGGDMGDEDMGDMGPMGAGGPPPGMGGPMAGDEMGGPLGGPPMGKKKPMPPQMMKKMAMGSSMYMRKEAADPQDAKMKAQNKKNGANDQKDDGAGTAQKKTTTVREDKCCDKCGNMMSKKCSKGSKMTEDQRDFNASLMRQAGSLKFQQDECGYWVPVKEDVLVQKQQPIETDNEPQPGEVGFAPQAKIGITGSNFTEWATRHAAQVKKNKKK